MLVPQLLLETLENLPGDDYKKFKWYLRMEVVEGCEPIPVSHLESPHQMDTVSKMLERYGKESAVKVTAEILRRMNHNAAAEELLNAYTEAGQKSSSTPSTSSTSSSPSICADNGSLVIAPVVCGSHGSWNIKITK
ncbi:pyrin-like [Thalassophryne amazonica]|uniref:pyrin-like n=1 Tax=Thalassophryne amazonica TaxID=390379 RepID=UPI0014723811|nr:pyrin-like [Thalassophryne amazonica]